MREIPLTCRIPFSLTLMNRADLDQLLMKRVVSAFSPINSTVPVIGGRKLGPSAESNVPVN